MRALKTQFKVRFLFLLTAIFGLAVPVKGYAASQQRFTHLTCKMSECVWYRLTAKVDIRITDTGRIVGATTEECVTRQEGNYPASYQCQPSKTTRQDYVAHCSTRAPSIAFKDDKGKWQRTQLSISEDGEFGYNRSSIDLYLRICHDYLRKQESLDMLAAKFGYRSRMKEIEGNEHDTINSIADLDVASPPSVRANADQTYTSQDFLGCFTRAYDDRHLAKHPDQLVTAVKLRIYPSPLDPRTLSFSIWIQKRGEHKALNNAGMCQQEGEELRCAVECDGGGVRLSKRPPSSLLMRLGIQPAFSPNGERIRQDERIRMVPCGTKDMDDGTGTEVTGGKDDHEFLLHRAALNRCPGAGD